jgi:hypothetical protein
LEPTGFRPFTEAVINLVLFANRSHSKFLLPTMQAILVVIMVGFLALGTKPYLVTLPEFVSAYPAGPGKPGGIDSGHPNRQFRQTGIDRIGRQGDA